LERKRSTSQSKGDGSRRKITNGKKGSLPPPFLSVEGGLEKKKRRKNGGIPSPSLLDEEKFTFFPFEERGSASTWVAPTSREKAFFLERKGGESSTIM